jgi:hypothetical protein
MENFNLKKFLVENRLTSNSRLVNEGKVPNINLGKLEQIVTQAGEAANEKGKKFLSGDPAKFYEFIKAATTALENQDTDWGYKIKGPSLIYMIIPDRYKGEDRDKWEKLNKVTRNFSSAFHHSTMNYSPKSKIDTLEYALDELEQYINSF